MYWYLFSISHVTDRLTHGCRNRSCSDEKNPAVQKESYGLTYYYSSTYLYQIGNKKNSSKHTNDANNTNML